MVEQQPCHFTKILNLLSILIVEKYFSGTIGSDIYGRLLNLTSERETGVAQFIEMTGKLNIGI